MALTHEIKTILRPGVQSILVSYKNSPDAPQWTDYSPGQRLGEGVIVKFSVTTYQNFTLTSREAYYSDAYDDTVQLTLSSVTGQSAWTFTMPDAEVYIRCEAVSIPSSSTITIPPRFSTGPIAAFANVKDLFTSLVQAFPNIAPIANVDWYEMLLNNVPGGNFAADTNGSKAFGFYPLVNYADGALHSFYILISVFTTQPSIGLNVSQDGTTWNTAGVDDYTIVYSFITETASYDFQHSTISRVTLSYGFRDQWQSQSPNCNLSGQNLLLEAPTPGPDYNSIRYIMSPESSGEVDASAPDEFEDGTTEFTFNWRIKASYDFKRIVSFAVGDGSTEAEITSAASSYDGSTRTYTFTVTQIPDWAKGIRVVINTIMFDNPSDSGGTNASDSSIGGGGTYDDSSDSVPLPAIPSGISASDSGLVTLFCPSITQVKDFGNYLWSHITEFWENLQKIFTSPMDYVIAFNILPVTPSVGTNRDIYIGNWLSNIQMPPVLNQFYEFNAGTIQVKEYFGSFLDYAPNTRARIMLPFIGDRDLAVNEIMGKTLHLWYRIDLLSGACVAILNVNDSVYYQWSGNCAVAIPVTGSDWSRLYSAVGRIATIGAGFAAFGAGGAMMSSTAVTTASGASRASAVADAARAFNNAPKGVPGVAHERALLLNAMENAGQSQVKTITSQSSRAISGTHLGAIVGHNMMGAVPRVQHTGDMSGAITIMGNRTPYIVLEYPNVNLPDNYKHFYGYPSNQYAVLGNLAGFTQCKEVLFESGTATDDEIEMIVSALKGGVYL